MDRLIPQRGTQVMATQMESGYEPPSMAMAHVDRPFEELRDSGLLWLINRTVFHPRGYALALTVTNDKATGWSLVGDGSEPWQYATETDEIQLFQRAEAALKGATP